MNPFPPLDAADRRRRQWRSMPWIGAALVAAFTAYAAYDIVNSYRRSVRETDLRLETQARVVAEQTTRSLQSVDLILRHLAAKAQDELATGRSAAEWHAYLRSQSVGLVQVEALALFAADGRLLANSELADPPALTIADEPIFRQLRDDPANRVLIGNARTALFRNQNWVFPIARRVDSPSGEFSGVVFAGGRIEYFQQFYREMRLDAGSSIALLMRDGSLLARHPPADSSLGQRIAVVDSLLQANAADQLGPARAVSPVDGVDRFGVARLIPDYPLVVVVTRETAAALAAWREQAIGTLTHTLVLGLLSMLSLWLVRRQFERLDKTHQSLAVSRERFALAAAGSDEGIWDWDVVGDRVYASARAREIFGLLPGPDIQSREQWFTLVRMHPDDVQARRDALNAHLAGATPVYAGEYRVQNAAGGFRWVRVRGLCVRDAGGEPLRMAGSVTDIDARKRAEDALRLSEERYALAMIGLTGGHWVWDVATDSLFVSGTVNQLFGLPVDLQPLSRTDYFDRIAMHPDDRRRVAQIDEDVRSGVSARIDFEYRILLDDGAVRWVQTRAQCFRDADGTLVRVAGVSIDIDDRKRTEEALRLSEERFALAVAGSNDGIVDWDVVNDRMYTSERTMEMLGVDSTVTVRSRAEWLALLRIHPDDKPRHAEELRSFLASDQTLREGEYRIERADGTCRWVRLRNLCVRDGDGRPLRLTGSVSDIDPYKRVEAALRESEQQYALAMTGSNEGHWVWDLASNDIFASAKLNQIMGIADSASVMSYADYSAQVPRLPEDDAMVRKAINDLLTGVTSQMDIEYRINVPGSGAVRWVQSRGQCFRDAAGKPVRMAGSISDIDARKRAEAERERLAVQLRQAQKLEAIGTLAGGIAHDFNNILAAILGYGEMALKDAVEGSAQQRHIDSAMSAGMRAKSLVERILAFSRSGMAERRPVHVQSVVIEALDGIAASLPAGIVLERRLAAGDAAVLGDPTQVHQVVMNLCANAAQAMKAGGSLVIGLDQVELQEPRCATCVTLQRGNYVALSVRDSGSGIAADLLERIFDPFFTTKEIGVGTGLGLSLVHGIVSDLGGGICVDSKLGHGTTFTVFLPWQHRMTAPAAIVEANIPNGNGETILLVDDEEPLVRLGEEMIALLGYEPVGFTSSLEALASFRAEPDRFHAVLSDEAMPDMTGSELIQEIRHIRPDIPIVLMSGYVTAALAARARDAGVAEVLSKPLVSRDIARGLASALRR